MKPKMNYGTRPKKTGAKKRQRILSQKRRLEAAGYERRVLDKLSVVKIRELLMETARRKRISPKKANKKGKK